MIITVLGAGNWGTTAALLLHGNGHHVQLWEYFEPLAREIIKNGENELYLKGYPIPEDLNVTWSLEEAVDTADIVVFAVPSSVMRTTARSVHESGALKPDAILVSLSKGLEYQSIKTMTEVIAEENPLNKTVALSGPCIASEVVKKLPTTIVSASEDESAASLVQDVFMAPMFRVYTSNDPHGIQLGGALKNIIALAAGINDGLGFGTNSKSALVARGIVEIKRFGVSRGALPETFNGLSGIGDLITTCFSPHSRNRRLGEEIGKGRALEKILGDMVMTAEGVPTTRTVYEFSGKQNIDMPITEKVYGILFEGVSPEKSVPGLMLRDRKSENFSDSN